MAAVSSVARDVHLNPQTEDGSFLVSGQNPPQNTYSIDAHTKLPNIYGFRLETLPDDSLPKHGSGRSDEGSFLLAVALSGTVLIV